MKVTLIFVIATLVLLIKAEASVPASEAIDIATVLNTEDLMDILYDGEDTDEIVYVIAIQNTDLTEDTTKKS